jgi:hypothetical protein
VGHTRNPWASTRTPGGSSGGEAVALATGMTPLGLGNDLGGSLRIPSQMCGTAAPRPTLGRIADAAVTEPSLPPISIQLLNCQGPMYNCCPTSTRDAHSNLVRFVAFDPKRSSFGASLWRRAGRRKSKRRSVSQEASISLAGKAGLQRH